MDFGLSEEQEMLQETVRGFVARECPPSKLREIFDAGRVGEIGHVLVRVTDFTPPPQKIHGPFCILTRLLTHHPVLSGNNGELFLSLVKVHPV